MKYSLSYQPLILYIYSKLLKTHDKKSLLKAWRDDISL